MRKSPFLPCVILILTASGAVAQNTGVEVTQTDLSSHSKGAWGVDLGDRDPATTPGDDLYLSQNGAWMKRTVLTETQPNQAYWRDLRVLSVKRLAGLLEEAAAAKAAPDTIEGKAGAFYRSFMDEKSVQVKGVTPLNGDLEAIRAARTRKQMAELMGKVAGPRTVRARSVVGLGFGRALFSLDVLQDHVDPSRYALFIGQAGLQLPGPEYYSDPKLADLKSGYQEYVARILTLIHWPDATRSAAGIVAFETRVAAASWSHEQMNDAAKTYNPMTVEELVRFAPGFDWKAYLAGAGARNVDRVVIDAKSAFPRIARVFSETPIAVLQARQAFAAADEAAPLLDQAMVDANFDFRGRKFAGARVIWPRTLRAEQSVEAGIVDILSALYVARYSTPAEIAKANEMAGFIREALDARLQASDWMSAPTKQLARAKLAKMELHIGYPARLLRYDGLVLKDDDLYGNVARSEAWNWRRAVEKLRKPFDRSEWTLAPVSYPTYGYVPTTNTMEITAGSLEPPFFDLKADDAVNYGAIGAVIAQQMVAAFDSHGGLYDADGRRADWWTPEERRRITDATSRLATQYSAAEPLPGVHVKGELVADEALDDLGAMLTVIDAYRLSLRGAPDPVLDGFTGVQRIFLGRAQMWRVKFSESFVRMQLATGANAHPSLRVNGPARNIDEFYDAFGVKPADRMYLPPVQRVHIW